jgi:hypothetical protein
VNGQPPTITGSASSTIPANQRFEYDYGLSGTPAPTMTLTSGTLPPGLSQVAPRYLAGTPTTPGSYTFTYTASNGISPDATVTDTIKVSGAPATIAGTPAPGGVGESYSQTFLVTGDPAPVVTRVGGTLPPGVTISPTGHLSGTPTTAGTFRFTLAASNGVGPAATRTVSLLIRPLPTISIASRSIAEGNSGTRSLTFPVTLNRSSTHTVMVQWNTVNGTATAPSDYVAASGNLIFAPGQTSKTITVVVRGDRVKERNETFQVHLHNPSRATVPSPNATGGIVNDD